MMPPLLAGLAAAVLFALALAFFLTPTKSIGYAPDQYADQQRTRWAGSVRSDAAVRVPVTGEAVARASDKLAPGSQARPPSEAPSSGEPLAPVVVPARAVANVEVLEAPLGAPIVLATRIGAEQAAVGFSADGDGPLGAREALAFLQPGAVSKPTPRRDPIAGRVQQLLNDLGYDAGPVDGKPGKQTWTAIERFRQDRSLSTDAPLDVALIDDLERARNDGWQAPTEPLIAVR